MENDEERREWDRDGQRIDRQGYIACNSRLEGYNNAPFMFWMPVNAHIHKMMRTV